MKPACRSSAGPRAEARIRTRLLRPVHNPPDSQSLAGSPFPQTAGSVSERKPLGESRRRPPGALCWGAPLALFQHGDTPFCLHKSVSLSHFLPAHGSLSDHNMKISMGIIVSTIRKKSAARYKTAMPSLANSSVMVVVVRRDQRKPVMDHPRYRVRAGNGERRSGLAFFSAGVRPPPVRRDRPLTTF